MGQFYVFCQSVPGTYTKEVTFTDKNIIPISSLKNNSGVFDHIIVNAQILTNASCTPAFPGSPGDGAYTYVDPVIQMDPSTPNAQGLSNRLAGKPRTSARTVYLRLSRISRGWNSWNSYSNATDTVPYLNGVR